MRIGEIKFKKNWLDTISTTTTSNDKTAFYFMDDCDTFEMDRNFNRHFSDFFRFKKV